ncbi:hypothetical protein BH10PSE9_BH10PSE9_06630 [soil metagenome]
MTIALDHIGLSVADYETAKKFYLAALKPLRIGLIMEFPNTGGFGADGKPFLWIGQEGKTSPHAHIAIRAEDRSQVDAFFAAAMAAGATDNGAPGIRAHYHENYYGAFVLDPDGHNIEAVCHASAAELAAAKAPAKKPAAKRAAAKKPTRKAAAAKKPVRKAAAKKPAKKAPARKAVAKKPAAKKRKGAR